MTSPTPAPAGTSTAEPFSAEERAILVRWAEKMVGGYADFPTPDKKQHAKTILSYEATVATLTRQLAEAQQDTARLDAIERGEVTVECMGTTRPYQWVDGPGGYYCATKSGIEPLTLREAIDKARTPTTPDREG